MLQELKDKLTPHPAEAVQRLEAELADARLALDQAWTAYGADERQTDTAAKDLDAAQKRVQRLEAQLDVARARVTAREASDQAKAAQDHDAADDKLCADYISTGKGVDAAIAELVAAAVANVEAGRRFTAHTKRRDIPSPGSATMALMHVIAWHLHKAGVPNVGAGAMLSSEHASYSKRLPAPRAAPSSAKTKDAA